MLKFEPVVRKKVDTAVAKIKRDALAGGEADVLKWFTFMATDVIGELSFGRSFDMLEQEEVRVPIGEQLRMLTVLSENTIHKGS